MTRTRAIVAGVLGLLALALAAYAVAAREADTVASYTGCLKNGKIESIAVGDTPLATCGAGGTQVRLGGGDVTAVNAGGGLTGGGSNGDLTLSADPATVQTRVAENCLRTDASISAIHQDGTVACNPDDKAPGTDVFAGFDDGPGSLPVVPNPNILQPIRKLALPAGRYAIVATLNVLNEDLTNANTIDCKLSAGADFDLTGLALSNSPSEDESPTNDFGRMTLQVVHEFVDPGDAVVSCGAVFAGRWNFLKITATRVANLTNGPLTQSAG